MLKFVVSEKRKNFRVKCDILVSCGLLDTKENIIIREEAIAKNISSEGIYLEIGRSLELGVQIEVKFQLPAVANLISAKVKVLRSEIIEPNKKFGAGCIFSEIKADDSKQINLLVERLNINKLMELVIKKEGSDLHFHANRPPFIRLHGEISPLDWPALSSDDIVWLLQSIMSDEQSEIFDKNKELDFAVQFDMLNRFRVNVHKQKGFTEAALRLINTRISSFEELNIPVAAKEMINFKDGLIIIAGPTGSGKTTTIAAIIDFLNHSRKSVIITLERPIEYVYPEDLSIIKQREVGADTHSFSIALKSTLRQDPNIIVVGELDDIETIKTALIAAEAGYLVIASFHAPNTIQALDRLVSMFPAENRKQILSQLSHCLRGIVTQLLIPIKGREGRVLVSEVMVATDAVKRIIRNDDLIQIPTVIQTGAHYKMQTMADSIKQCAEKGLIDLETANFYSEEFSKYTR